MRSHYLGYDLVFSGSMTSLLLSVQAVVPDQLTYVAELAMSECAVAFVVQEANVILIRPPPFWDWPCAWHVWRLMSLSLPNERRKKSFVCILVSSRAEENTQS